MGAFKHVPIFEGVEGWFEDLWNWISEQAWNTATWMYKQVSTDLTDISKSLSNNTSYIYNSVKGWLDNLDQDIISWIKSVPSHIWRTYHLIQDFLTEKFTDIENIVGDVSNSVKLSVRDWSRSLHEKIEDSSGFLAGQITGLSGDISAGLTSLGESISKAVHDEVSKASEESMKVTMRSSDEIKDKLDDVPGKTGGLFGEALKNFADWFLKGLGTMSKDLTHILSGVAADLRWFFEEASKRLLKKVQELFSTHSPPEEEMKLAQSMSQTILDTLGEISAVEHHSVVKYESLAAAAGSVISRFILLKLGVEAAAAAAEAGHPTRELGTYKIAAGVMGIIDMPSVIGPLISEPIRQGLLIPWQQYWAARYTPQIPGAQDLIEFVVKEVMPPEEFYTWMKYQGYSEKWAHAYWDAHWRMPSFGQLVDAYHRGIISKAELDKYIVWWDYSPTRRPGISKNDLTIMAGLIKTLIPRVDLRRGWELGAISDEELLKRYQLLGYEDDAELMAEIQKREAMRSLITKLVEDSRRDFIEGFIDEDTLRANLKALSLKDEIIEFHIEDAKADREREYKKDLVDLYIDSFVKDYPGWDEDALRSSLQQVIVIPDVVDLLVSKAVIRKFRRPRRAS